MNRHARNLGFFLLGCMLSFAMMAPAYAGKFKPFGASGLKGDKVGIWYGGETKPTTTYTVKSTPRVEKLSDGTDITLHRNLDFKHKTTYGELSGTLIEAVKLNRNQILETLAGCIRGGPLCVGATLITAELIKAGWEWMDSAKSYVKPVANTSKDSPTFSCSNAHLFPLGLTIQPPSYGYVRAYYISRTFENPHNFRYFANCYKSGEIYLYAFQADYPASEVPNFGTKPVSPEDISKMSDDLTRILNPDHMFDFLNKGEVESSGEPWYQPHTNRTPDVPEKNSITVRPDGTTDELNRTCYSRVTVDATGKVKTDKICTETTTSTKPDGTTSTGTTTETVPDDQAPEDRPGKPPVTGGGGGSTPDPEPEEPPTYTDTAMPEVPNLYEQKYPDGFGGVWAQKWPQLKQTEFVQAVAGFFPTGMDSGTCPQWSMSFSVGKGMDYGEAPFDVPCWIFGAIKALMLISAVFTARQILWG